MSTDPRARAWVDVSAEALRANFRRVRDSAGPEAGVIPMVKADAYGLGMPETLAALLPLGPRAIGVATVEEGLRVRSLGVDRTVLVLSPVPPGSYPDAVEGELTVSVGDLRGLDLLARAAEAAGRPGRFHLDVDTGMGRAGFDWHRVEAWATALAERLGPPLAWEGVFTHFHSADAADPGPTLTQWERLGQVLEALPDPPEGLLVHACNSPGALRLPELAAGAVRPGIFLYGGVAGEELPPPRPVAALRARVSFLRDAVRGSTVGYGSTYAAPEAQRWATVAIGYGDGLPRLLSNRGHGLVRGRRAPIIGRVSMDVTVLDVSRVPGVQAGEVVTFFGRDGDGEIPLEEVAGHARTINYEVLTGLTRRLPRIWTDDGGY